MNEPVGVNARKWARPCYAGGSYIVERIIGSRVERGGRGGRLPPSIGGTGGLMITGNVSLVDHLKGPRLATHIRLRTGVKGISHPDIRDHDLGLAGSSHDL